jgi:hypothetical protein
MQKYPHLNSHSRLHVHPDMIYSQFLIILITLSFINCFVDWSEVNKICGNVYSDRIIGGKVASLGSYPWFAFLGFLRHNGSENSFLR